MMLNVWHWAHARNDWMAWQQAVEDYLPVAVVGNFPVDAVNNLPVAVVSDFLVAVAVDSQAVVCQSPLMTTGSKLCLSVKKKPHL